MIITIQMEKSRTVEAKRAAADAFTKAAIATLGAKAEWVTVLFEDYEKINWAIGGELLLDRHARMHSQPKADGGSADHS